MRHFCCFILAILAINIPFEAQEQLPPPTPQTARQALIEMFFGKEPDAFAKHLPVEARHALIHKGETPETSIVQRISMLGRQMTAQGRHVDTFDVGPTLLTSEPEGRGQDKFEVLVDHDSLMGENDEIELSIQIEKNGQPQFLPVIPRLIFSLTMEKEIWRLSEITIAGHFPLTDPDYLKGVRKEEDEGNERAASMRVGMIVTAEKTYLAGNPSRGYTCSLTDLFGKSETSEGQDPIQTPPPGWAASDSNGYHFSVSGCDSNAASRFQITAVPVESESDMKTFCADESGTVRFEAHGKGPDCLKRGQPISQAGAETD